MTACRDKAQFDYADRLPSPQELAKLEPVLTYPLQSMSGRRHYCSHYNSRSWLQVL